LEWLIPIGVEDHNPNDKRAGILFLGIDAYRSPHLLEATPPNPLPHRDSKRACACPKPACRIGLATDLESPIVFRFE
jgi:hypothetical protein